MVSVKKSGNVRLLRACQILREGGSLEEALMSIRMYDRDGRFVLPDPKTEAAFRKLDAAGAAWVAGNSQAHEDLTQQADDLLKAVEAA